MLNVQRKVASLNINWFCKYLSDELNAGCKCMFNYCFEQIGGIKVIMNCKYNLKKTQVFWKNKMPHFYYNLIMTFFLNKSCYYPKKGSIMYF